MLRIATDTYEADGHDRTVQTAYVYDALNRVTNRNYTAPNGLANYQVTPNVSYFYDNLANAKGKLIKVASSVSTTEYTAFDILGRVTAHKQTTDSTAYTTGYVYNLSGALIEETYPSGRVVKNTLDADGSLSQVQSKKANDTFRNYANSFNYTAAGAVSSMRLGNGKFENTTFNSRLQPTQIGLGASASTQNLLKLNYDYGTTDNNGNVKSQMITVPTVGNNNGFTATQTYTYDSLNRLKDAKEMIGTTQTWKQTFTFDRYGNRNFDMANTTTPAPGCQVAVCNPTVNAATNRLNGYGYDASGNTTTDAQSRTFVYDAENKQTSVTGPGGTVGQYWYDGDGRRIKKIVPATGETTIFVYDAGGKLVAEYSTVVAPPSDGKVSYLTSDHLGSPRITTDANGAVISRRDFHPFSEEVFTPQRTQGLNYTPDTVRQKFTSYERDIESDLDFAEARYYNSQHGRFTSPDPYNIIFEKEKGKDDDERSEIFIRFVSNPQQWNMYVYVLNNPLSLTDPDGRLPRTVNVFIGLPEVTEEGMKEWEKFKADAAKKGITVNIYTIKDKTATPEKFLESIKAKDTVTIFAGHSFSRDGQKVGIEFHNGGIVNQANAKGRLMTADGVDIQNDAVVVFSCDFGKAFDNITSSNGAAFVSLNNGADGKSGVDGVNQAGLRFAQSIADSSGTVFTQQNDLTRAVLRGQSGLSAFPSHNKGDQVVSRSLFPAKRKR